jgi:predicted Fe-S protein YdhL (DUF1289 family)
MKCPNQFSGRLEVSEEWCDKSQYSEWCRGCERDLGREVSLWQEEKEEENLEIHNLGKI